MKRRDVIALLGATAVWPLTSRAQQRQRVRRVGVLLPAPPDDADAQAWLGAFLQGLQQSGWSIGDNVRIEMRWAPKSDDIHKQASQLVALAPDVILAHGAVSVGPLLQLTRTIPIVFPVVVDPVAAGYVDSLSRPGGNATGLMLFEYSMSGKWLELLKQIAPSVARVAVFGDSATPTGPAQFASIQSAAPKVGVEVASLYKRDPDQLTRAIAAFAQAPNGGLIVPASRIALVHRGLVVTTAAKYKLPAIYYDRSFVAAGGLLSYGPDRIDLYRRAAGYVDRILKGEMPGELPVQTPTKYQLVVNLKTAKALGLIVPPSLLAQADEVIE